MSRAAGASIQMKPNFPLFSPCSSSKCQWVGKYKSEINTTRQLPFNPRIATTELMNYFLTFESSVGHIGNDKLNYSMHRKFAFQIRWFGSGCTAERFRFYAKLILSKHLNRWLVWVRSKKTFVINVLADWWEEKLKFALNLGQITFDNKNGLMKWEA